MYDIRKRKGFQTVGELRAMLNHLPAYTKVSICGDANCFYHEARDGSLICLDCEDLSYCYEEDLETMLAEETLEERDRHLESLRAELADAPMNPGTDTLEKPLYFFSSCARRDEILRWFDQHHSKGVAYLLDGEDAAHPKFTPLGQFLQEEVPHRLTEILDVPSERITGDVIRVCVETLNKNTDILFNYDRIDMALLKVLKKHGICEEDA